MKEKSTMTQQIEPYRGLQMAISPEEAKHRHQELMAFVAAVMVPGVDFGNIPGTDKPTLLQPGAQKLCEVYGFAWTYEDVTTVDEFDKGFFFYRRRCVLTSRRTGAYVGDGRGSCNSREDRYAWRWLFDNEVPAGVDIKTLRRKEFTSKKNGRGYTKYRLPNEDIYSLVNTIEKMACKRALVHAVIGATRSAGVFTQDAEDLPAEAFGTADGQRSWGADTERKEETAKVAPHDRRREAPPAPEDVAQAATKPSVAAELSIAISSETSSEGMRLNVTPKVIDAKKRKLVTEAEYQHLKAALQARGAKLRADEEAAAKASPAPEAEPVVSPTEPAPPAEEGAAAQ